MRSHWKAVGTIALLLVSCCNKQPASTSGAGTGTGKGGTAGGEVSGSVDPTGNAQGKETAGGAPGVQPGASGGAGANRSEEVDQLVGRLQRDLDKKNVKGAAEQSLSAEDAKKLKDTAVDFSKALLEEGVRYVGFLLKDDEVKKYYGESMSGILLGGRRTSIEGARKKLVDWVGKAPCDFSEPVLTGETLLQSGEKSAGYAEVEFKTILLSGTIKIQGAVLTEAGWKFLSYTPALHRKPKEAGK